MADSDYDVFRALRANRKRKGEKHRQNAAAAFAVAADMAHSNGLKLVQKNETHYQLRGNRWLLNLYPGNQRIYADRQQANTPPWLNVPDPWTLTDVVRAAIGASKCK